MDAILPVLIFAAVVAIAALIATRARKPAGHIRPRGPQSPADPRKED